MFVGIPSCRPVPVDTPTATPDRVRRASGAYHRRMVRWSIVVGVWVLGAAAAVASTVFSPWWLVATIPLVALALVGTWDLLQRRHNVLRNYPILGHMRFLMDNIRPEIQQYFIETPTGGTPFDRETRDLVYQRAKGTWTRSRSAPSGTCTRSATNSWRTRCAPGPHPRPPSVRIGGPDCGRPYDIALLNVSAMSFGVAVGATRSRR